MTPRSVEHATLMLEQRYDASPARVFAAWADPAARERWSVRAEGWEMTLQTQDFRVGGQETGRFRQTPGEPLYSNDTLFVEIVPATRIVFAYSVGRDGVCLSASLATVELLPDEGGTRLVFTEQAAFLDGGERPAGREAGWRDLLQRLERELAGDLARARA